MMIQVLLFAQAKQAVGQDAVEVEVPDNCTVTDLLQGMVAIAPQLAPMQASLLVAINNQFASRHETVSADDAVACFPPVSGG